MNTLRPAVLFALSVLAAAGAYASGTHPGAHHADELSGRVCAAARTTRTVSVAMADRMRYAPANIEVEQNETVRFVVTNSGKLKHEIMLGTDKDLMGHYEALKKNPAKVHAEANMVTLAFGQTGEVVWESTKAGKVDFACLQPRHYEAGMKGAVTVSRVLDAAAWK